MWKEYKIKLVDKEQDDMGLSPEPELSRCMLDLNEVCMYFDTDNDDDQAVEITLKGGGRINLIVGYGEFKRDMAQTLNEISKLEAIPGENIQIE